MHIGIQGYYDCIESRKSQLFSAHCNNTKLPKGSTGESLALRLFSQIYPDSNNTNGKAAGINAVGERQILLEDQPNAPPPPVIRNKSPEAPLGSQRTQVLEVIGR